MNDPLGKLYDFLCDIGEVRLANKLKGMPTSPKPAEVRKITGEICIKLFARITRSNKPSTMSTMDFDSAVDKATKCLQRVDHIDSLKQWAKDILDSYVTVHKRIKE